MVFLSIFLERKWYRQFPMVAAAFSMMCYYQSFQLSCGHAENPSLTMPTRMITAETPPNERIAIVYKIRSMGWKDSCLCGRFVALVEGTAPQQHGEDSPVNNEKQYDVILLHEPGEQISPSLLQWIETSRHRDRVQVLSNPVPSKYLNATTNGFRQASNGKASFLLWLHELQVQGRQYTHYWFVEDDMFWTGRWGHFFETNDRRWDADTSNVTSSSPDFVSVYLTSNTTTWEHGQTCRIHGQACHNNETQMIGRTMNNMFRISNRFAAYLLDLIFQGELEGHDEAAFIAALEYANNNNNNNNNNSDSSSLYPPLFVHTPLFANESKDFQGFIELGGWSAWDGNPRKPAYSLRGLAEIYRSSSEDGGHFQPGNRTRMNQLSQRALRKKRKKSGNMKVPHDKMFHPVKCLADRSVGVAALAFASGVEDLDNPIVQSLQIACQSSQQ